ncbi:predicted protein [Chaetomium globosum CBS 148.51]|uniref:Uncharacterized protein n=1 Tax=Chaetomium globosum (strain ATCC 6205 / CBS 148.51 / DSM 1962 / NBRC 6347 / NRRL 1970) TaxID=306901 RepID=Q2H9C9_CHAGB|nr:uncharacterized protein CHGG_03175 [Chaetomium globosum CBS 148.51]EAQ91240.1 predicted protein [Chaetomium globosum CBS 148.51]
MTTKVQCETRVDDVWSVLVLLKRRRVRLASNPSAPSLVDLHWADPKSRIGFRAGFRSMLKRMLDRPYFGRLKQARDMCRVIVSSRTRTVFTDRFRLRMSSSQSKPQVTDPSAAAAAALSGTDADSTQGAGSSNPLLMSLFARGLPSLGD